MIEFLNSPAFHLWGNPASWAELIGAMLGVVMVVCNIRQIHWGWPLAFASSVLYVFVFASAKLYAEAALQIFFAIIAIWGWLQWLRGDRMNKHSNSPTQVVRYIEKHVALKIIAICAVFTPATAIFLMYFTNTDVPWADALPTVLSIAATYLLGKKYIENWPAWIVVNLISIALFSYKGLWLTVGLYAVFVVMAAIGWQAWRRLINSA